MNNYLSENIYELIDIYYNCFSLNQVCQKESNYIINLLRISNNNKSLLDLGCGTGCITIPLASNFTHVFGIDKSSDAISLISKRINLFSKENIEIIKGNWIDLQKYFSKNNFDIVLSWGNSLIYTSSWGKNLVDPDLSYKQIKETIYQTYLVLKHSGYFILQTISDEEIYSKKIVHKTMFVKNQKFNHLLDWKIEYNHSIKTRINIARREVYSKDNILIKTYESKFIGYAISSLVLKNIMENMGFSHVTINKDYRNNYDIIIARK